MLVVADRLDPGRQHEGLGAKTTARLADQLRTLVAKGLARRAVDQGKVASSRGITSFRRCDGKPPPTFSRAMVTPASAAICAAVWI